jgi:hypothetical protein
MNSPNVDLQRKQGADTLADDPVRRLKSECKEAENILERIGKQQENIFYDDHYFHLNPAEKY